MQISAGMRISDVCSFCYEHTIDQPCPVYDAWQAEQDTEMMTSTDPDDHPLDCLFCRDGEGMVHTYEPSGDNPYEEI